MIKNGQRGAAGLQLHQNWYNESSLLGGLHYVRARSTHGISKSSTTTWRRSCAKTPAERIAMIDAANRTARLLARAGIRYQHPDWNERQIEAEVLRRVCGGTI